MSGPHPALKRLERPVGTWVLRGRTLDSNEDSITGTMTCEWLPGGFFLQQISELRFNELRAYSLEIISYDPKTNIFPATVYSSMSGTPLLYYWMHKKTRSRTGPKLVATPAPSARMV